MNKMINQRPLALSVSPMSPRYLSVRSTRIVKLADVGRQRPEGPAVPQLPPHRDGRDGLLHGPLPPVRPAPARRQAHPAGGGQAGAAARLRPPPVAPTPRRRRRRRRWRAPPAATVLPRGGRRGRRRRLRQLQPLTGARKMEDHREKS